MKLQHILLFVSVMLAASCNQSTCAQVVTAAEQTHEYLPKLKGKKVAVVANQTSVIGTTHLVDSLLSLNVNVDLVFAPEHGFRGLADAGEHVADNVDMRTGLRVVSLYGNHKKPSANDLLGIDIVVFDIQDVGVRFYTYISTLHYVMEACAENNVPLLVLDRPNPNGFYIDGPILDTACRSFVGMHPVPLVHGMTIGEYALMINGQGWLNAGVQCQVEVVKCLNYTHKTHYQLPIKPSPNLPTYRSVLLYPSLGLFEGTSMSVARGTMFPFEAVGHPAYDIAPFRFVPRSMIGAKHPPFQDVVCFGYDFRNVPVEKLENEPGIDLDIMIDCYRFFTFDPKFFNSFLTKLAGTTMLRKQIEQGMSAQQIKQTWQQGLRNFQQVRKQYLLYTDFE
ncbi:MAG: DUF1343 domain-containing protein [Salinivirgaceae bacterium]|nr:DUF1343 domain-containing protein [Salinivirgaceae bacterium]